MTGPAPEFHRGRTSFYYSFSFLPKRKRRALTTVYLFCRGADDLVDDESDPGTKLARVHRWKSELKKALGGGSSIASLNDLADVARSFGIPDRHFHDLLDGVEMDIATTRYGHFNDLVRYCELVASSVGLMCIDIFGLRNERTEEFARRLGIALQLTNIIRDVGVDAGYGRIYLPAEEIRRFDCTEEDILRRNFSEKFRDLLVFQADRAREFYAAADSILLKSDRAAMYPAMIMKNIYAAILERIRREDYRVFDRPVRLPRWRQFSIAAPHIIASWMRPR